MQRELQHQQKKKRLLKFVNGRVAAMVLETAGGESFWDSLGRKTSVVSHKFLGIHCRAWKFPLGLQLGIAEPNVFIAEV